jgi:hypothetical protein
LCLFSIYLEPNSQDYGAAFSMFNAPNVQLTFRNVIFENHIAYGGAAVYLFKNTSYAASTTTTTTTVLFDNVVVRNCQSTFGSILISNVNIAIQNG